MLSANLSYKLLDWLTVSGRVRLDNSNNDYTEKFYATTNTQLTEKSSRGLYGQSKSEDKQLYADFLININKTFDNNRKKKDTNPNYNRLNIYEATRGWWVLDKKRAENTDFVLAEYKGVIRAIFKPDKWIQDIENRGNKRWGFEGSEVLEKEILDIYINKEVPKIKGMANPIRYFEKIQP